nr:MAG: ORF1 [Anelloviridae sp.]
MPWWRTWRRRYYKRRWRRPWRRRSRYTLRRRLWRPRRYRVRRKKLKKLRLLQWQPHYIRHCKIIGFYPMALATTERTSNNLNLYLETAAPHYIPSGGSFSIDNFSLETLYREHMILRNVWTQTNDNLPLVRYIKCVMYLYRSATSDWLFYYNNQYPMKTDLTMYQSCQPYIMLLNNKTKVIPCKQYNKNKKSYKKITILPPTQMQNKWYFQRDMAQIPLLQTMATLCSLDRMYTPSNAISTTIGIYTLDTLYWQNHQFTQRLTTGYLPKPNTLIFGVSNGERTISNIKLEDLIYLGNTDDYTLGDPIKNVTPLSSAPSDFTVLQKKFYTVQSQKIYWGNPFRSDYFHGDRRMLTTNYNFTQLITEIKDKTTCENLFTELTSKYFEVRYNPYKDKGIGNKVYLLPITTAENSYDWTSNHADKDTIAENLPLWAILHGYLDFQKKWAQIQSIDTKHILVIYCTYLQPQDRHYIVPLDYDFIEGTSPYRPQYERTPSDEHYWHPKVSFQLQSINAIVQSGPATIKLPKDISAECHIKYRFYFKFGGSPAPMATIQDPDEQPKFITPDNIFSPTSLQNPTMPLEQYLCNFDERRGMLTKTAAKRIKKQTETEKDVLPITETSCLAWRPPYEETSTSNSSESEEEEPPQKKILRYRREQKQLRHRINKLLLRLNM